MNRLLINMENKRETIFGAINQLKQLKRGEKIEINGLHSMIISRGKMTDKEIDDRIYQLEAEASDLWERCDRMRPEVDYGGIY